MDLTVRLGKLKLKNPVTVASGTFGYATEFKDLVNLKQLGAMITKTITCKPKVGNPQPRLAETSSGMLNAIGLQNEGLDNFLKEKLPVLKKIGTKIIVSISATNLRNFLLCAQKLEQAAVKVVELNLSCPNIKYTSLTNQRSKSVMFAQDCKATFNVIKNIRDKTNLFLIAKLSPNVTDIGAIAHSAEDAGADAVSLINTFPAMAIDINTQRPKLANITGGLSGPAIKPIALRMVYEAYRAVKIPIIGMGGITSVEDAIEFMLAGATAISIGTANFVNPKISMEIIKGLKKFLRKKRIKKISQLIGAVKI